VVVDMQNDFIATGGYYERRTELDQRVARGKLSLEARNRLLSDLNVPHPGEFTCRVPSLLPIVDNICRVIEHARRERRPVVYLKAVYDRTFAVQPPSLRQAPERNHYPCKANSWGAALIADPTKTGIVSAEQQQFGAHTATVLTVANLVNTNDPDMRLFFYRPSPNILIMIVPVPQTIIDTPDFQALLSSIVLTPDEQITLPTITPAPALIDASCAG
jgi:hypothetical protein